MIVGFTGTRKGASDLQKQTVGRIIVKLKPEKARHGMCEGADTNFHWLLRYIDSSIYIIGHPPIVQGNAFVDVPCEEKLEPKPYLERDKDIVTGSDAMIATPDSKVEKLRSGTWTTIRYAKKAIKSNKAKCKRLYIVYPDGEIDFFNYERLTSL